MSGKTKKESDKAEKEHYRDLMRQKATQMSQALMADRNEATQTNEYYNKIRKELNTKKKSLNKSYKAGLDQSSKLDDVGSGSGNDEVNQHK